jgi:hypothetical protein
MRGLRIGSRLVVGAALLLALLQTTTAMMAGGYSPEIALPATATPAPQSSLDAQERAVVVGNSPEVRQQAEAKAGRQFEAWTPVSVQTQVVAGTNYLFKARF